jgi:nucleoside 2-deoxyribosyltransferase
MSTITCPFCGSDSCNEISSENNQYDCPSCGKYQLDCKAEEVAGLPDINADKLCDFAGYLHETNYLSPNYRNINITTDDFENEVYSSGVCPKTTMQKVDKLLLNLYKYSPDPIKSFYYITEQGIAISNNEGIIYDMDDIAHVAYPVCYAKHYRELAQIIVLCHDSRYIIFDETGYKSKINNLILALYEGTYMFRFTIEGMKRAESLISSNVETYQIFIACKFNNPDTGVFREDFVNSVKEATEKASNGKYHARIVSEVEYNDGISDQIKAEIKRSKAVIADYTYENQGVYFEAGYACGLGIPVIRCCEAQWAKDHGGVENAIHFDERHNNLILWNSYKELQQRIEDRIRNILM